jgi:hypothetical protein
MKKSAFLYLALCLAIVNPVTGQKSGFLNKVTKSVSNVTNDVLGTSGKSEKRPAEPEPSCANDQASLAMDLGGKLQLDYRELAISVLSDGRILAKHYGTNEYYIAKDGVTIGPYKEGDPKIADFVPKETKDDDKRDFVKEYPQYISKSGEKYLITFGGKKYGPYAQIDYFALSGQKTKFAALVTETVVVTESESKRIEEAVKNAKSDEERMQIAMEYAQKMQQAMTEGGGLDAMNTQLISNVPAIKFDPNKMGKSSLDPKLKYDDLLLTGFNNEVFDLQGKLLFSLSPEIINAQNLFIDANNTKYAWYANGKLTFSDNTALTDLFNPALVNENGKEYIRYMYYSPGKNAIMQYRIPF